MSPPSTAPLSPTEELDSPIDGLSHMSLEDEASDTLPTLPKPRPVALLQPELTARSSTDPSPSALLQSHFASPASRPTSSHRNRSPYSRSHLRSKSGGSTLGAPLMTRSHSMPNPHALQLPASASTPSSGSLSPAPRSPARTRSPTKEELGLGPPPPPRSPSFGSGIQAIHEEQELDLTPRSLLPAQATSAMASFQRSGSLRRDRRRPEAFNETYPSLHHFASTSSFSSMPSTPTSTRSRSPSISSLDTIEDEPDLESEAQEIERLERLKMAAERQERLERGEDPDIDKEGRRRSSLDVPRSFGRIGRERKRWSICGGERRADLDLETIWED
ncbi:endochitinase A-like [Teratosphaeria destructans]|uniref:Endochitinase A-like n=1 Tax=Teratosphaeria destructans TaxID=418781 RepID=A0A9W7W601_9PEZI|nr:endochitinase A-like [Teratosphaeria destructans]